MRALSASVLLAHEQRPQVQEGCLVERLREQIGNLLLSRDPVDVDDEVKVELAGVLHPDLDGWQQGGERGVAEHDVHQAQ